MKLLFKQRMFSWFDSYDIYDEAGNTVYTVKGQLSWGHCFKIYDANENCVGTVKQRVFTFLPAFDIYDEKDNMLGTIVKEFSFFKPKFTIDFNGWYVDGDFFEWDYSIVDSIGVSVATVSKEVWNWTDTYSIDVVSPEDALHALMLVLAIDAEKCSRD